MLLHAATETGDMDVVRIILSHGADVNAQKSEASQKFEPCKGATALHIAAYQGHIDIMGELLSNGASLEIKDERCYTPLNWSAKSGFEHAVRFLLQKGANPDGFEYVLRPLHFAAINGNVTMVQNLLEKGANINAKTISQDTALQLAACNDHIEIVEILLKNGANIRPVA